MTEPKNDACTVTEIQTLLCFISTCILSRYVCVLEKTRKKTLTNETYQHTASAHPLVIQNYEKFEYQTLEADFGIFKCFDKMKF